MRQLSLSCGENLATNIFKNNRPRLEVHHQHGLELSLGPLQLHLEIQGRKCLKNIPRIIFVSLINITKVVVDCPHLSCAASHLNELSGYYLHHFSHLEMNVGNDNNINRETK